jgi:hypothetical protein
MILCGLPRQILIFYMAVLGLSKLGPHNNHNYFRLQAPYNFKALDYLQQQTLYHTSYLTFYFKFYSTNSGIYSIK